MGATALGTADRILLIGAGGHARSVLDVIRSEGRCHVAGLIDSSMPKATILLGLPVLGQESDLPLVCQEQGTTLGIVAIGDNWQRRAAMERLGALVPGFAFVSSVHPSATVADDVTIGPGTVIMAGAVVVSGSRIGKGCIVNTLASLDHDGVMEDYASLAPGAVTGGRVHLGTCAAVGLGARIVHNLGIGAHAVVGAGALVMEDIPSEVVAFGVPAQVIRRRAVDDPYL
jgi:sugar O-acyltransferase (sialic acid O-acetyltransferase NeuD family)